MKVIVAGSAARPFVLSAQRKARPSVIRVGQRGPAGAGGVESFNAREGVVTLRDTDVTGALGYTPVSAGALADVAFSGQYAALLGKPVIPETPADIGAATAAQGAKADTAVQPNALGTAAAANSTDFATAAQGALADTAAQAATLAPVATSGSYGDLTAKPFIPTAPGDVGAATEAQGGLADTAVQPAALTAGLSLKVDKAVGYGLSQADFTPAEKAKLAGLESSLYRGTYANLAALQAAQPSAAPGAYADVDAGIGSPVLRYIWDANDAEWVAQAGSADPITAAQVKALYESNADTYAYTSAERSKLASVAANATANPDTDSLSEGSANKWFTAARVLAALLTGLSVATGGAVVSTDSVLAAIGKLQKQITDLAGSLAGKQATLVSGTNIKTINGASLLGAGNVVVEGGGGGPGGLAPFDVVASENLVAGDHVNIYTDGGAAKARKADGSAAKRKAHGFVKAAVLTSETASVTPLGGENDAVSGLTPGVEYFLSTTTPGSVQAAAPNGSGVLRQSLGVAVSATQLATTNGLTVELV